MLFSQPVFLLVFLPVVLTVYYVPLRGNRGLQNGFLLLASLLFYAWGEPLFVLVMMVSMGMNYRFGLWAHQCRLRQVDTRLPVTWALVCNLGLLFVFKYLTFALSPLSALGVTVPVLRLPVGISFFTFQALSYVLDVAWGKVEVQRSLLDLGLYISFFPQLIAGPIVKYATIAREIQGRRENWADFSAGCVRFLIGLGKKVILANQLAVTADRVFSTDPAALSTPMAWLGSVCYTFQIFYDFSGYSDMAIGLGRMFGFHFLENFRYPYIALSIRDFWRRWHISLSTWFRDYLYIPLGGSRVTPRRHLRNLLVVWLLTGLWHGAAWTFVLWGLGYFALLALETRTHYQEKWPKALQWAWTLLLVHLLWVLFRSDTGAYALGFYGVLFGLLGTGGSDPAASLWLGENASILLLSALFATPFAPWLREKLDSLRERTKADIFVVTDLLYALGLTAVGVVSLCYLVKGTYNPFIYFRF